MDDKLFQRKVDDLIQEISCLPTAEQEKLRKLAGETKRRQKELKKSVSSLQESLDFLRISVKYILFDLEATRRENTYLRKMLEGDDDDDNHD